MNPLKCAFGVSTGNFLGFLVHSRGIDIDHAKVMAIVTMKPPATVKELKSFLGKVSYIKRFVPSLVSITSAFTKLLKKRQSFKLGGEAPVHRKPLQLYLASSPFAIGALIT